MINLIEKVSHNYRKLFIKQSKPTFPITDYNTTLFKNLTNRNLVLKYVVNPNDDTEYKVFVKYQ